MVRGAVRPYRINIDSYYHASGGIRALHVLRDELRSRGLQAEVTHEHPEPIAGEIMLYPEIIPGNPRESPHYVRWLLNEGYFPDEHVWGWRAGLGADRLLTVNIIEDFWRDRGLRRRGVAYWIGKGEANFDPTVLPEGAREISRSNWPDREELAEYVAGLELLITFDPFTAVIEEAVMSRTPVMIAAPLHAVTAAETPFGVAWGRDEVDFAYATVGLARERYIDRLPELSASIDRFVEDSQALFA